MWQLVQGLTELLNWLRLSEAAWTWILRGRLDMNSVEYQQHLERLDSVEAFSARYEKSGSHKPSLIEFSGAKSRSQVESVSEI